MSHEPTMFWILKSVNFALKPSFWIMRAYFRDASFESSSDFAPVTTILPEAKIRAVVFGSQISIMTAAKRYSRKFSMDKESGEPSLECQYLWIVFRVPGMQSDRLEIQAAIEIDRGNDVSLSCKFSLARLGTRQSKILTAK